MPESIKTFQDKLKESKQKFENVVAELARICQGTSGNELLKKSIDQVLSGQESRGGELDGKEMIEFLTVAATGTTMSERDEIDSSKSNESSKVLDTITQNLDASRASSSDVILIYLFKKKAKKYLSIFVFFLF